MTGNQESPCKRCERKEQCSTMNCLGWKKWFSQRWKKATETIRKEVRLREN